MAIRAENDSYSLADVLYARAVRPSERVALRKAAGLTETELAKLIGAGRGQLRAFEERLMFPRGATGAAYGCWLREQRRAS